MLFPRRQFLVAVGASFTTAIGAKHIKHFYERKAVGQSLKTSGFGPLREDPNGLLDLPQGFHYRILSRMGEAMSDGTLVPGKPDGMSAFPGSQGNVILVRNHELWPDADVKVIPSANVPPYDPLCCGGTTTLVISPERTRLHEFVSLAGTSRNCAGGATPWGSWISCEESVITPAKILAEEPFKVASPHGYAFEVPAQERSSAMAPLPLKAMGRFRREAIAVDPKRHDVYQTEDRPDGCFYRFRPHQPGQLSAGGQLEALAIAKAPGIDTSVNLTIGQAYPVQWLPLQDVDPPTDSLRFAARSQGAAIFKRGEGICWGHDQVYWTCTNGGQAEAGQIFRYDPQQQTLELFVEAPKAGLLNYPDNLTLAPFGDLIVCEDGPGEQFLVGIAPDGSDYPLAHNALNLSEFAGSCFAPDGQTLFVNIQTPGLTLAIWGPWENKTQTA